MPGLIFVTASNALPKPLNRFLLTIRDWEYGSGDRFRVVATKNTFEIDSLYSEEHTTLPGNLPDENPWAGSSIKDVETFCLDAAKESKTGNPHLFIVLDDEGVEDENCVLAERAWDDDYEKVIDTFKKVRIQWKVLYDAWCNLDIANVSWNEICDDGYEPDDDGWWQMGEMEELMDEDNRKLRDQEIKKFEEEGKA